MRYSRGGRGLVVVAQDSPIRDVSGLRGKLIAGPDRLALVSLVVSRWLDERGLQETRDYRLVRSVSFNTAVLTVQRGEAVAAISAPGALQQMPAALRDSVRVLGETGDYTNLIYLASPAISAAERARIRDLVAGFGNKTEAGKKFLEATGFGSVLAATDADMAPLDQYVAETRRLLRDAPKAP